MGLKDQVPFKTWNRFTVKCTFPFEDLGTLHLKEMKSQQVVVVFKPLYDLQTNPVLLSQPQGENIILIYPATCTPMVILII